MISSEERKKRKKLRDADYIIGRLYQRCSDVFGHNTPHKMLVESFAAFEDAQKSVVIKDRRAGDSTHHLLFVTTQGGYVRFPITINDEEIIFNTVIDIRESDSANWFINKYNEIARTRGMPRMNFITRRT